MSGRSVESAQEEIRDAVDQTLTNIQPIAQHTPSASVGASDFNMLLNRAKAFFPHLAIVQGIPAVEGGTTMGELVVKLGILQGAIKSHFTAKVAAEVEEHDRQIRRQWDEFNSA